MNVLEILQFPDPILFIKANPILEFTPELRKFASNLMQTMLASNGAGITSCQVGNTIALMIVCDTDRGIRYTMCNPIIEGAYGSTLEPEEGCLSRTGVFITKERPTKVIMSFQNVFGSKMNVTITGFGARVAAHEYEHILGYDTLDTHEPPYKWTK